MSPRTITAPAKINLCLLLGPARADGRHELVTLFQSVSLCDTLAVRPADRDEVVCADLPGPNLVAAALAGLRAAGWAAPPLRIEIDKRIPVAAGMGGGSADAAALLRHARDWAPVSGAAVARLAASLGADVPAQLHPGTALGTGAGEIATALPAPSAHAVLVLPQAFGLSTPDVYREADRLGLGRSTGELELAAGELAAGAGAGERWLGVNDLQAAAVSLAPEIADALDAATGAGAQHALVCGSGPTVIGLFAGAAGPARAQAAAATLRDRWPRATAVTPV